MDKKTGKFAVEDLILVSIPTQIKNFKNQPAATGEFKEVFLPHGAVWELAIISPDKTEFVLLREFVEKKVRACNDYVKKNACGEFEFKTINSKESYRLRFIKEDLEEKKGIVWEELVNRNSLFIYEQINCFEQYLKQQQQDKKDERFLQKCRKEYLSVFEEQIKE